MGQELVITKLTCVLFLSPFYLAEGRSIRRTLTA